MMFSDTVRRIRFASKPTMLVGLLLAGLLTGCQSDQAPSPEITAPRPAPVPVPKVAPVTTRPVQWKVYTVEQLAKLVAEQKAKGETNFVLIAITPKGYENLSLNMTDLERYIREQKRVTMYLKKVIDDRASPVGK